jgi:hypothetical protein
VRVALDEGLNELLVVGLLGDYLGEDPKLLASVVGLYDSALWRTDAVS